MSRLFDRIAAKDGRLSFLPIFRRHVPPGESSTTVSPGVFFDTQPIVVSADNVCRYLFEVNDQEEWDLTTDFPSLAPPWPSMFIEFSAPSCTVSRECGVNPIDPRWWGSHRGVWIRSMERADIPPDAGMPPMPAEARWLQTAGIFVEFSKHDICLIGSSVWLLRPDGTVIDQKMWPMMFAGLKSFEEHAGEKRAKEIGDNLTSGYMWPSLWVAALTLSFINCRNTVLTDHPPPPELAKAAKRRGKGIPVTYKTLEIEPVKKVLADKGKSESKGLKHAMHICRGHFKDYRQRGLFGKAKGMYWWGMHLRGDLESGLVVKDYKVKR